MPTAYKDMREEIKALREAMHETIGFMIRKESREAESAEAKAFDRIDAEQFLVSKAEVLEEAEAKAVAMSKDWDSSFQEYVPVYNKVFNVRDFSADMTTLVQASQIPQPPELARLGLVRVYEILKGLGNGTVDPVMEKTVLDAIKGFVEQQPTYENVFPDTGAGQNPPGVA